MHIVDGALAGEVVAAGAVLTLGGLALGVRQLTIEKIPAAGMLSAAFFVASLIHVPLGPSSVHLVMGGLAGLVLGMAAFPALFVGLLLQTVFFGYGGLTVLGVNAVNIALPAVIAGMVVRPWLRTTSSRTVMIAGGVAGGLAIALTTIMVAGSLALSGEAFLPAAAFVLVSHLPVIAIEALLTSAAVLMIHKVKPELFHLFAAGSKSVAGSVLHDEANPVTVEATSRTDIAA